MSKSTNLYLIDQTAYERIDRCKRILELAYNALEDGLIRSDLIEASIELQFVISDMIPYEESEDYQELLDLQDKLSEIDDYLDEIQANLDNVKELIE
jgi:hypothetical protein